MKISQIDVETPHSVSWTRDQFGVVIHGVAKHGVDCTHELTDAQLIGIRDQIEGDLKRDREDEDAARYYGNLESREALAEINMNRRL